MNMTKKQIEKRYNKLIDDIESMSIYDGRGTVDRYECKKCGAIIHTTYAEKGVTPFSIGCRMCGSYMQHTRTFDKATVPPSVKVLINNGKAQTLCLKCFNLIRQPHS